MAGLLSIDLRAVAEELNLLVLATGQLSILLDQGEATCYWGEEEWRAVDAEPGGITAWRGMANYRIDECRSGAGDHVRHILARIEGDAALFDCAHHERLSIRDLRDDLNRVAKVHPERGVFYFPNESFDHGDEWSKRLKVHERREFYSYAMDVFDAAQRFWQKTDHPLAVEVKSPWNQTAAEGNPPAPTTESRKDDQTPSPATIVDTSTADEHETEKHSDDVLRSPKEWAAIHGVKAEPLRKRLQRWREKNLTSTDFSEMEKSKSQDPGFYYRGRIVLPIIAEMKRATATAQ